MSGDFILGQLSAFSALEKAIRALRAKVGEAKDHEILSVMETMRGIILNSADVQTKATWEAISKP